MEFKIKKITLSNPNYPASLKKIASPPKVLYLQGRFLARNEKCLAIVGTRRCSNYGKEIAFSFGKKLSEFSLTIVSGLARGIDTFAHQGALAGNGRTIAVLATGLDKDSIYPKENIQLAEKILAQKGTLISEYPPKTPGFKKNFPERNRIIAGISLAVLVIEAPIGSGALITAKIAKSQKKPVFVIPGTIFSKLSEGCHYLIRKEKAILVQKPEDILEELKIKPQFIPEKKALAKNKLEKIILEVLSLGPTHIDKIIKKTSYSPSQVISTLTSLELEEKIKNLGGGIFSLNKI